MRELLHEKLRLQEIYVGEDFVFGHQRDGNLDLLREMGGELGFAAHGVPEVSWGGERISSTRIRRALGEGKAAEAAEMLGRPYSIAGTIVRGDRMGQKLGWPTINVTSENKLLPADGVYAARVFFPSYPATFDGVTNIGTRPTVYENYQRVVESHILDFKANVYGQRVELQFHKRLREERIFPTVMDLSAQIGRDVEATREYFAARRRMEQEVGLRRVGRGMKAARGGLSSYELNVPGRPDAAPVRRGRQIMASEKILTVTEDNFETEVLKSDKPVLVDFWATWCGPCRAVAPVLDADRRGERQGIIAKLNVDEQQKLAYQYPGVEHPHLHPVQGRQDGRPHDGRHAQAGLREVHRPQPVARLRLRLMTARLDALVGRARGAGLRGPARARAVGARTPTSRPSCPGPPTWGSASWCSPGAASRAWAS